MKKDLRLDKAFYPKAAVEQAVQAFSHLAQIERTGDRTHHVLSFSNIEPQAAGRLLDEFANFVLTTGKVSS